MKVRRLCLAAIVLTLVCTLAAQSNSAPQDSATFDPDGTAHITRVIPMPTTISPEARKWLESLNLESLKGAGPPESLAERRTRTDAWRKMDSAEARKLLDPLRKVPGAVGQMAIQAYGEVAPR